MNIKEIKEGEKLRVMFMGTSKALGTKRSIESFVEISYDDLLVKLLDKRSNKTGPAVKFSRYVSLFARLLDTGKWVNLAVTDANTVFPDLYKRFEELTAEEYNQITPKALKSLTEMKSNNKLNKTNKKQLLDITTKLDI